MLYSSEISPTRCNNCVFITCGHIQLMYSWWWVRLSPETTGLPVAIYSICTPDDGWDCRPKQPAYLWPYTAYVLLMMGEIVARNNRRTCGHIKHMYSWWWVRLSPETTGLPVAIYSICTPDDGWDCRPKHRLTCGHIQHMYSWWWVRLSPETCRVKPLRWIKTQFLHLVGLISLLCQTKICAIIRGLFINFYGN